MRTYLILTMDLRPLGTVTAEFDEDAASQVGCTIEDNADVGVDFIHPRLGRLRVICPEVFQNFTDEVALEEAFNKSSTHSTSLVRPEAA